MERLYTILRNDTAPFTEGHCDICNQTQVKVKPLRCSKHSYCRMCQEFVPRFVKGDFSCTKCSTRYQKREAESLETVEKFLAEQTEVGNGESARQMATTCPELLNRVCEVEDDDSDLEGGNTEWDHLLQSICEDEGEDANCESSVTNGIRNRMYSPPPKESSCCKTFAPIPRKPSFLRLGLTASGSVVDEQEPSTSKQPIAISNTVTELLNPPKYAALPAYIPARALHRNSSSGSDSSSRSSGSCHEVYADRSLETGKLSSSSDNFLTDPDEQERGSSPCKLRRPSHQFELCTKGSRKLSAKKQYPDCELTQELGRIDGPASDTSIGQIEGPASDTSLGNSEGPASDTSIGQIEGQASDPSIGHIEGPALDISIGHIEGPPSDTSIGHIEGPPSDTSIGHIERPASNTSIGHIEGPASDSSIGNIEGPASDSSDTDASEGKDPFWDM